MIVKELDPSRVDADLAALLPIWGDHTEKIFAGAFRWGAGQLRMDTGLGATKTAVTFAAFAEPGDAEAVGFTFITLNHEEDLDTGDALVMLRADHEQDPDGAVAAALLAAARAHMAAIGRGKLTINLPAEPSPGYAPWRTGPSVFTSLCSILDLAAVDAAQIDAWAEPSPANHEYRLVRWIGQCPENLIEAYAKALSAMDDAPQEDLEVDHPHLTAERLRGGERAQAQYDMQTHVVAAVTQSGEIAGSCKLAYFPDADNIGIWNTSVTRAHRGHGLGLRIKADSTRWLRDLYPQTRWIYTFNNHQNEYMIAVNRRMGYQHINTWHVYVCGTVA